MLDLNSSSYHEAETDSCSNTGSSTIEDDSNTSSLTLSLSLSPCNNNDVVVVPTRQFFPMPPPQDWLNLSAASATLPLKKSRRGPRSRSSQYRGVTFYRRTGRWESHIWDCGKQVYLGGFDTAHAAARAYDRAAIKFRGVDADINFIITDYQDDMKQMKDLSKEDFIQVLRRQSNGFSRGSSKYKGVTLQKRGRWEAPMAHFPGKMAYDKTAIKCYGREAVINYKPSMYANEIKEDKKNDGSGEDLDLNLWISPPWEGQKGDETGRKVPYKFGAHEMVTGKRVEIESSCIASHSPSAASQLSIFTGMYPAFSPHHTEGSMGNAEATSSPGFPNWAWKIHSQGVVTPVPAFSSSAASSGFSTATPLYPSSHLPPSNQLRLPSNSTFQHPTVPLNLN